MGNFTQFPLQRALLRGNIFLQVSLSMWRSLTSEEIFQDNTEYAFLQMDDRVLVYRGADQPDMSVINPESDVWQHIKVSL
jgi:RAB6A-GEF complex partner protein 1